MGHFLLLERHNYRLISKCIQVSGELWEWKTDAKACFIIQGLDIKVSRCNKSKQLILFKV